MSHLLPACPTEHFVLLCAVEDADGVLRFPEGGATPPGWRAPATALTPINPQLFAAAAAQLERDVAPWLAIEQQFADPITDDDGVVRTTLYVGRLDRASGIVASAAWPVMPQILRRLGGRARIPYLRAWQVLAGGLYLETKAVDAAEVAKYFDT